MSLEQLPRDLIPYVMGTLSPRDCLSFGLTSKRHLNAFIYVVANRSSLSARAVEWYCRRGHLQSLRRFLAAAPSYIPTDYVCVLAMRSGHTEIAHAVIRLNPPVFRSNLFPWHIAGGGYYKIFNLLLEYSKSASGAICGDTAYFSEILAGAAYRGSLKIVRAVLSLPYSHVARIEHTFIMLTNGGDYNKIAEEILADPVIYCDIDVRRVAYLAIHFCRPKVLTLLLRHPRMNLAMLSDLIEHAVELGHGEMVRLLEKSRRGVKKRG